MGSAALSDALIHQYYAGSDEAFDQIYAEWWRRLVHFLTALGAPWHVAEELAQEALYRIARTRVSGSRYNPGMGTFDGWILMVARHLWVDHLRRKSRRPQEETTAQHDDAVDGALLANQSQPARQETDTLLHQLLTQLPREQREALILHDFEGLSYREAAKILEVPQGTVASRRDLGLTKLRAHWSAGEVPEGVAR